MLEITLKTVEELKALKFHVPFYQRGYRWKKEQVKQLLNDINQFLPTEKHPFYFLQALAIAKCEDSSHVVDGQQRLTTLALILNEPNKDDVIQISYDRGADQGIDKFYKLQAQTDIDNFFKSEEAKKDFQGKILNHCRFLYYEIEEEKELQTFGELNSGKIPAKDSELVKCLLLSPGNDESAEITQARASEWDMMERKMQDDNFFSFMTPRNTWREDDRMTILLRYAGLSVKKETDDFFPFLIKVQSEINETSRMTVWKKICAVYYRLLAWHEDPLMYHVFGWYVHRKGSSAPTTLEMENFRNALSGFSYKPNPDGDDYNCGQNDHLYSFLLLHNVAFCWHRWPMRYDFKRHRKIDSWSLEHIFARNQRDLTEDELKQWIPEITQTQIDGYKKDCEGKKGNEWLAKELQDKYPKEEDNSIMNIAMLPKDANSALNNSLFEGKRQTVIECAEANWSPYWIPPVTEAVFLKSLPGLSMTIPWWSDTDKKKYKEHIDKSIDRFLDAVQRHFNNIKEEK